MKRLCAIALISLAVPLTAEYYYSSAEAPAQEENLTNVIEPADFYVQDTNIVCPRCKYPVMDTPDEAYSDPSFWPGKNEDSFYDQFTN